MYREKTDWEGGVAIKTRRLLGPWQNGKIQNVISI